MTSELRRTSSRETAETSELSPKVSSGVAGLDEILEGGFPEGRTTLISGGPGTGKTMLGLEFLYRSAVAGQPGILLLFEEQGDVMRRNVLSLGWDLAELEKAGKLFILEAKLDHNAILSGDFSITPLLAIIQGQARRMVAKRIVIDAIDVLLRVYNDVRRECNEIHALHDWLTDNGFTTVLTTKKSGSDHESASQYGFLDYMADCLILLDLRVAGHVTTRRLRVIKYRGSGFASNEYPYVISDQGSILMPVSTASLDHKPLGPHVSSGNEQLDVVLNGGYRRSSSVLVTGASGTGKTTLACTFVKAACDRGEKVLYISFEESGEALISSMLSPGIDLQPAVRAGMLEFLAVMPEAMGVEQHLLRALRQMDILGPEHIVVDAISACKRIGDARAAFDYLMRLVDICKQRGITALLTNQLAPTDTQADFSGIGFSSLIDATILLRFIERDNQVGRDLLVLKSRGSKHSSDYREFLITNHGIRVETVQGETNRDSVRGGRRLPGGPFGTARTIG